MRESDCSATLRFDALPDRVSPLQMRLCVGTPRPRNGHILEKGSLMNAPMTRPEGAHKQGASGPRVQRRTRRLRGVALVGFTMAAAPLAFGSFAHAGVVATVPLLTSANYSVLGGESVTNTGSSTLDASLGVFPGSSITGFPPGLVVAPGVTDTTNAAAQQAQSDSTAAYVDAAGRSIDGTTTADLSDLDLKAGVYAGPSKAALGLTGTLTLDGAGDPNSVFIFQTNSTLITGSGSTVRLINGAQECNVFWQVGSSATLGTGSVFVGNILAQTSISVTNGVTVHGRALAQTGGVTLDNDTFTRPTCELSGGSSGATTTVAGTGPENVLLPRTGSPFGSTLLLAVMAVSAGVVVTRLATRKNAGHRSG